MSLKAREIPKVREIPALLRFNWLNRAIVAGEENAFAVGLIHHRQPAAIARQSGVLLNECVLGDVEVCGHAGDFAVLEAHLTWPPATGGAALAFVEDRHGRVIKLNVKPGTSQYRRLAL